MPNIAGSILCATESVPFSKNSSNLSPVYK
jgi:hypothetical protein